jgi:hypothetical protein
MGHSELGPSPFVASDLAIALADGKIFRVLHVSGIGHGDALPVGPGAVLVQVPELHGQISHGRSTPKGSGLVCVTTILYGCAGLNQGTSLRYLESYI